MIYKNVVLFNDYISNISHKEDCTLAVKVALAACTCEESILSFNQGEYHFWPDNAFEKFLFISNNDYGLKRIIFPLINRRKLTIDGGGSKFVFHGRILPILVEACSNICLKNFIIDYDRTFFTEGIVLDAGEGFVDVEINEEIYPFRIDKGKIVFTACNWESDYVHNILEFDKEKIAPIFDVRDNLIKGILNANYMGKGIVRLLGAFKKIADKGNILHMKHEKRLNPTVLLDNSYNLEVLDVTIYHSGTMGIIAQLCKDIVLQRVKVCIEAGSKRMVSLNADATHFVNCRGNILIEECVFENQFDDAVNIHGNYLRIYSIIDEKTLILKIMHFQQNGVNIFRPGDKIAFVNPLSLTEKEYGIVKDSIMINQELLFLYLEEKLSENILLEDGVDNITAAPNVVIRNCKAGKNRGRGFLLKTPGKILVENNYIYTEGSAIKICCDMRYWNESSQVKDLTIRNNHLESINQKLVWGRAVIDIDSEIVEYCETGQYCTKGITIENNEFITKYKDVLYVSGTEDVTFRNNRIQILEDHKPIPNQLPSIGIKNCNNVKILDNIFSYELELDQALKDQVNCNNTLLIGNIFRCLL